MKPRELFDIYKVYLTGKGRNLSEGSLLHVRTLINISERNGMEVLTQSFIDNWCAKRATETLLSCQKRRGSIRLFLRFCNSKGLTNLDLPTLFEIVPKHLRKTKLPMTEQPLKPTSISSILEGYISYLRVGRPKICGTTHKNLIRFNNFLAKNFPDEDKLTDQMVHGWCDRRETENNDSRNTRVLPIRNFLKYAVSRELLDVSIPEACPQKQAPREPHIFTEEELADFFHATVSLTFDKREHDKPCILKRMIVPVYFRLLYSTGMRTNEARDLRCQDVDLENGVISIVHTKGIDQHRVALHSSMLELIRRYNEAMDKILPGRKVFFPTEDDTCRSIEWQATVFRELWSKLSTADARAYDFRSNYAVRNITGWTYEGPAWFDKLIYLSRSMGHRKIESTCYYFHLSPSFPTTLEEKSGAQLHSLLPDFDKFYDDEEHY